MNTIYFFGYGLLRDRLVIKEIIGKEPKGGYSALLENHIIYYQDLKQIPDNPRTIVYKIYGSTFRIYTMQEGDGMVLGSIWEINEEDFEKIKEWDFVDIWRKVIKIYVKTSFNEYRTAYAIKSPDGKVDNLVDGLNYEINLNPQGKKAQYENTIKIEEIEKIHQVLESIKKLSK